MPAKVVQCRWGILGCDAEAARFAGDLQAAKGAAVASTSSTPVIQHSIVAVSSSSKADSQSFADSHIYSSERIGVFGTSTELHAHPAVDAVFIAGTQSARFQESLSALRGGKAVLLHKPLAITSSEAQQLFGQAKREKPHWLGLIMRKRESEQSLSWAADECALGIANAKAESEKLPWSEALGILEALDDLRANGAIRLSDSAKEDTSLDAPLSSAVPPATASATGQPQTSISVPSSDDQQGQPQQSRVAKARNSLPASRVSTSSPVIGGRSNSRPRTSSMDRPFADVGNVTDGDVSGSSAGAAAAGRRRRKDQSPSHSPVNGFLGLQTVPEGTRRPSNSSLSHAEGFLSPTIASENRRLATAALGSPVTSTPGALLAHSPQNGTPASLASGRGSSKVIEQLTTELHASRMALEDMRMQLRTSQRTVSSLQRTIDETREALSRSRAENETNGQILARKDRQHQEVLERARKAETQAKELGKSSREWGTRLRKIEAELGEERIVKQRAEMQYDAIAASWKQTREAWEKEMSELRTTNGEQAKRNRDRLQQIQEQYQKRDEHGKMLSAAVADLQEERVKAARAVLGPVRELTEELAKHEAHTASQDAGVQEVQDELKRILRLMRNASS